MGYGPNHYVIRRDVAHLAKRALRVTTEAMPIREVSVHGEVLEVRRGGGLWHLTLLDTKHWERSLHATLPVQQAPDRPEQGRTISLFGTFSVELDEVDLTLQLVFRGDRLNPSWRENAASRITRRRDVIDLLSKRYPRPARLACCPQRIALVTGGSNAQPDFEKGLGWRAGGLDLVPIRTALEVGEPESIAHALREAGALQPAPDVIVLMRGGGAKVMLERFSAEVVLEAAAEVGSRIPLLVAVGHKRNWVAASRFAWHTESTPEGAGDHIAFRIALAKKRDALRVEVAPVGPEPSVEANAIHTPSAARAGTDPNRSPEFATPATQERAPEAAPIAASMRQDARTTPRLVSRKRIAAACAAAVAVGVAVGVAAVAHEVLMAASAAPEVKTPLVRQLRVEAPPVGPEYHSRGDPSSSQVPARTNTERERGKTVADTPALAAPDRR